MLKVVFLLFKNNFKEILMAYVAFLVLKSLSGILNKSGKENLDDEEKLPQRNTKLSDIQAKGISENLYKATVGEVGTDERLIHEELNKLENQDSFNHVFNEFGKRQYSKFWGHVGDPLTSGNYDLIEVLVNELNSSEQEEIKDKYPHLSIF